MRPVVMPHHRFPHFYLGGSRISDLRGEPGPAERAPEEWLASATTRWGSDRDGLSVLPDGSLLRDAIRRHPHEWLGKEHVDGFGAQPSLLVKLLDAGQRLPVHVHPDRSFARTHLACGYGKTEAWYVVSASAGATVHLGFREDIDPVELADRVERQDVEALLGCMYEHPVAAGDGIVVPAGLPHAIGEGVFVVEAQEPTDFSVLLEWTGFDVDGRAEGHLGLGFPTALGAVDLRGRGPDEVDGLFHRVAQAPADALLGTLPAWADDFFRVHVARPVNGVTVPAGFAVVVALAGTGELAAVGGGVTHVSRGDVLAVPYAAGEWTLRGDIEAVVCRPGTTPPPAQGMAAIA